MIPSTVYIAFLYLNMILYTLVSLSLAIQYYKMTIVKYRIMLFVFH